MYLKAYLASKNASYAKLHHPPVMTAQELASVEHVTGKHVAKPVIVRTDDVFVMCVVPASAQVNLHRVAELMGTREAMLATEAEMINIFPDTQLGAEPPFGEMYGLPTVMDKSLHGEFDVVFQSGKHTGAIRMPLADFQRIADPIVENIARWPGNSTP